MNGPFFTVCDLLDEDTPGVIDYGGSASELAAARVALRACNAARSDMCVVDGKGKIVQRVRYRPSTGAATVEDIPEPAAKSEHLTVNLRTDEGKFVDFVFRRTALGQVITVSASVQGHPIVNVTAK